MLTSLNSAKTSAGISPAWSAIKTFPLDHDGIPATFTFYRADRRNNEKATNDVDGINALLRI